MQTQYWILTVCVLGSAFTACEGDVGSGGPEEPPAGGSAGAGGGNSGSGGRAGGAGAGGTPSAGGTSGQGGAGGASGGAAGRDGGLAGGAGAAPVACASPNTCDGFESYVTGGGFGAWRQNGTSGTLAVDALHVFSGAQAVRFEIPAGANRRVQLERSGAPLFPATNNAFWGRVMVWAENLPGKSNTEDKNVHYDVIQASGTEPGEYRVAGMGGVLLNYEPHDCYYGTSKVIPQSRWACWEWLYDGAANVIEFYIDGQLQARVESKGQGCVDGTSSVWDAPTFNALRIGFVNYQSKAEITRVWMDDFAAGAARIGCPTANAGTH